MDDQAEAARTLLAIASAQAAEIVTAMTRDEPDEVALADQFMAAGLDCLAEHGIDARTQLPADLSW